MSEAPEVYLLAGMAIRGFVHINPFDPNTPASVLDVLTDYTLQLVESEEKQRKADEVEAARQSHIDRLTQGGRLQIVE